MSTVEVQAEPVLQSQRARFGFWIVAYALLIVMAFATLPSPLFGLYRLRDHLSALTITVAFAIYAAGTVSALLAVPRIARRIGRKGVMVAAVATMTASAVLLAAWTALPGLLLGRLITGVGAGLAAGTAVAYLIELGLRATSNPSSIARARIIGTSVTVGALGVGPLIAGFLAQWASWPLHLPYLVFVGLGVIGLAGLVGVPETGTLTSQRAALSVPASAGASRLPIPAAAGTFAAFAASGLFAGLTGIILATTLHRTSHALAGTTLFLVFNAGVVSQLATNKVRASGVLAIGTVSMLMGLALLVVSVRISTPNLALFLVSGALVGAGEGAVYKGTTGIVLEAAAPERRLAMTSALLIALYVGLSIPVIGAGIALNEGASIPNTVLGFAILVAIGVSVSGWLLVGRHGRAAEPTS